MHADCLPEFLEEMIGCLFHYCGSPITAIALLAFDKLKWAIGEASNPDSATIKAFETHYKLKQEPTPASLGYNQ